MNRKTLSGIFLLSILKFCEPFSINAYASSNSLYPLECGTYELGQFVEITGSSTDENGLMHLSKGTLSETELKVTLNGEKNRKARGTFWFSGKIEITTRRNPYVISRGLEKCSP